LDPTNFRKVEEITEKSILKTDILLKMEINFAPLFQAIFENKL
jgi:hypothetical protein